MSDKTQRYLEAWQQHLQQGNKHVTVELNADATEALVWQFAQANGCEVTSEGEGFLRISTTDRTPPSRTQLLHLLKIYDQRMYTGFDVSYSIKLLIQDLEDEESGD